MEALVSRKERGLGRWPFFAFQERKKTRHVGGGRTEKCEAALLVWNVKVILYRFIF